MRQRQLVESRHCINIHECDNAKIKVTVDSQLKAVKARNYFVGVVPSGPNANDASANNGQEARGAKRRRANPESAETKSKVRVDDGDMLPSSRLHRMFNGASSHLEYRDSVRF